jgi:hypothetical protein
MAPKKENGAEVALTLYPCGFAAYRRAPKGTEGTMGCPNLALQAGLRRPGGTIGGTKRHHRGRRPPENRPTPALCAKAPSHVRPSHEHPIAPSAGYPSDTARRFFNRVGITGFRQAANRARSATAGPPFGSLTSPLASSPLPILIARRYCLPIPQGLPRELVGR